MSLALDIMLGFALGNIFLFVASYLHIRNNHEKFNFIINWGFLAGIFVWEDAFMVSFYNLVVILISYLLKDFRWLMMAYLIYWVVRGLGETVYYMLQQFFEKKPYPHNENHQHNFWKFIFGDISPQKHYILTQISVQVLTAFCFLLIILLLKFWDELSFLRWF